VPWQSQPVYGQVGECRAGAVPALGAAAVDWLALDRLLRVAALAGAVAVSGLLYFGVLFAGGLNLRQFVRK